MYWRILATCCIAGVLIGLGWPPFAAAVTDPYLYITISPPQPGEGDTLYANYSFHCDGPITVDQTSVAIGTANIDVLLKVTCYGLAIDVKTGSVRIGSLSAGHYTLRLLAQGRSDPGIQYTAPSVITTSLFTVQSQQQPTFVIEFYHASLNHYFITGDAGEAAWLTNNPQLGWQRTGQAFRALVATSFLTGPLNPVCRFYGSVTPGPNSHFFTLDPAECAFLKQLQQSTPATQPRWNYETIGFVAAAPQVGGSCPSDYPLAVRRFYNNRAIQNESNHRYVTDAALTQQMRDLGWRDEGIVMCGGP